MYAILFPEFKNIDVVLKFGLKLINFHKMRSHYHNMIL
jgi:hypothetical protein